MPTAVQPHTTPTRRSAIGFSLAALTAGLTVPALASAAKPAPDAELIALCNRMVAIETELCLLADHDGYAPDFGPNNARYEQILDDREKLMELIADRPAPTGPAGIAAMARAALTWVARDSDGDAMCTDFGEEMMLKLAEGVAAGFVWPPRPGDCSTAHWAPPTSAREVAEHKASWDAEMAELDAKVQAEKEARSAERRRWETPALLTDDELRKSLGTWQTMKTVNDEGVGKITTELARRGLVA